MSALAGNAARLLAACLPVLFVNGGAARAGTCVSASWYHEGSHTASGERFRPDGLTAAHRSLRMGTHVRVINKRNGHAVVVRINDRGPAAWTRRGIDLSRGAARALGMIGSGVAHVCYQVVDGGGHARHAEVEKHTATVRTAHMDGEGRGRIHHRRLHRLASANVRRVLRAHAVERMRHASDDDA